MIESIKADLKPTADDLRATPFGQFEYQLVQFPVANTDVAIKHRLVVPYPGQICYSVMQQDAAGSVYHNSGATRAKWGNNTIFLRASAPMTALIMLTTAVNAAPTQFRE